MATKKPAKGSKSASKPKKSSSAKTSGSKPKSASTSGSKAKSSSKAKAPKASSKARGTSVSKSSRKEPRPKKAAPASTSKPARTGSPVRRFFAWLALETSFVVVGVILGLVAAGWVLWRRAESDVDLWMATPRSAQTADVLSAPMRLEVGQPADIDGLSADLLLAGYAEVATLTEPDQFRIVRNGDDATVEAWTGAWPGPGRVTEGRVRIRIIGGRIASTDPDPLVLKPTVLARLGELETHRTDVALGDLSPWVAPTVLAMEDARFRDHSGVDPVGIIRAVWHNATTGGRMHGGSTLTQQLAKNLFLSQERTARRKVREAFFAAALEQRLGKDRILELYLGEVYLGQVSGEPLHGVEQAARAWFGTSADQLSLDQAAVIAGVISAPNAYSPVRHPEAALERRNLALARMQDLGWASADEVAAAKNRALDVRGTTIRGDRRAPWTVDHALELAEDSLGPGELVRGAYRVHTTIQPHLQRAAERSVRDGLAQVRAEHPEAADAQAALIVVRADDGAVVAHVGSRDYAESPFDRATDGWRQAGSTVKPLTLLAALDSDPKLTAMSTVMDEPISRRIDGKPWTPRNADRQYEGEITLRRAVEQSRNVPMVKVAEEVGPNALQARWRDLGLSEATNLPSAALGAFSTTPEQLAGAYTVFPGGGEASVPRLVTAITTASGERVVAFAPETEPLASARAAAQATSVMQGVITHGTLRRARAYEIGAEVGGKTGTTDDGRDAWVAGVTPHYVVVAWVGRDKGAPLGLGGSRAALPIWGRMVADGGVQGGRFPVPPGMETASFCRESGKRARDECEDTVDELFPEGDIPTGKCDLHGGPAVKATRFFGKLFGRDKGPEIEGNGEEADLGGD